MPVTEILSTDKIKNSRAVINDNFASLELEITTHVADQENPHGVTKAQVELENVDNTSDIDKPISTAVQNALNGKQAIITTGSLSEDTSSVLTITGLNTLLGATSIQVKKATSLQSGYLDSADFVSFSAKQNALTFGNLTEDTSSILTINDGTNSIIGTGLTIQVKKATTSQDGYISKEDWTTFNAKQPAGSYEITTNKATDITLGGGSPSNILYPSQKAVKSYVDTKLQGAIELQGDWDASTNTPDITGTTQTGYAWRVSVSGTTNLGGITTWFVGDLAVKTATGWMKVDNQDVSAVWGNIGGSITNQTDLKNALDGKQASLSGTGFVKISGSIISYDNTTYEVAFTKGNLSETTSSILTITGGTNAIIGSGLTIAVKQSSHTQDGYLSSGDWDTFNGKQGAMTKAAGSDIDTGTNDTYFVTPKAIADSKIPKISKGTGSMLNGTKTIIVTDAKITTTAFVDIYFDSPLSFVGKLTVTLSAGSMVVASDTNQTQDMPFSYTVSIIS